MDEETVLKEKMAPLTNEKQWEDSYTTPHITENHKSYGHGILSNLGFKETSEAISYWDMSRGIAEKQGKVPIFLTGMQEMQGMVMRVEKSTGHYLIPMGHRRGIDWWALNQMKKCGWTPDWSGIFTLIFYPLYRARFLPLVVLPRTLLKLKVDENRTPLPTDWRVVYICGEKRGRQGKGESYRERKRETEHSVVDWLGCIRGYGGGLVRIWSKIHMFSGAGLIFLY